MTYYNSVLRDPRWQRRRLEIMQRDDFTCRFCHSTHETLTVHHEYYVKGALPWEYPDEALTTLCESCHICVHDQFPQPPRYKAHPAAFVNLCLVEDVCNISA